MSRYAVNLCDLSELTGLESLGGVAALLMQDFASRTSPIIIAKTGMPDTSAVILDGPASSDEERSIGLIELLQTIIGPRKIGRRIRAYKEGPRGGWMEVRPTRPPEVGTT